MRGRRQAEADRRAAEKVTTDNGKSNLPRYLWRYERKYLDISRAQLVAQGLQAIRAYAACLTPFPLHQTEQVSFEPRNQNRVKPAALSPAG